MQRILVFVGALVAAMATCAGPAGAAVTGLERIAGAGVSDSTSPKSTTAFCSGGRSVLGAGGEITGGLGEVVMDSLDVDSQLTTVTAGAREDGNGTGANWDIDAYAICAQRPPGLERVARASASSSANKNPTVTCPTGKVVLGAAGFVTGGGGQVLIDVIRPDAALRNVTVGAREDESGFDGNWTVTAVAICADPIAGLERVVTTSASNSTSKATNALCPNGKQVVGAGGDIAGGSGQVVIDDLRPNSALTQVLVTGDEDETEFSGNWTVSAYAICAPASQLVATTGASSSAAKSQSATCPASKQLTGLGGDVTGALGQAFIDQYTPEVSSPNRANIDSREDQNGTAASWFLRAYAICVSPPPGLERVSNTSTLTSADKGITATCPAGKQVLGVGGALTINTELGLVEGSRGDVVIDEIKPSPGLSSVTVLGREREGGSAEVWGVRAYAMCAEPPPGLERVATSSPSDSDPNSVIASCPADKNLLGTGAEINSGNGQVVIDDLRPNSDLRSVTVAALEDETGFSSNWTVTAHAICADP